MKKGGTVTESAKLWARFQHCYRRFDSIGLGIDISRMNFQDAALEALSGPLAKAFGEMASLESGQIANPDEHRMVGHYWLRNAALAPTPEIQSAIDGAVQAIRSFAADVHSGKVHPDGHDRFTDMLLVGIGGSALGPQFVADALGRNGEGLAPHFFDNTDPDGMDVVLDRLADRLATTLVIVVSKSGGTKETRNGMLEVAHRFTSAGLDFADRAVAVTGEGSELDQRATSDGWLARFPMWDWVGGRTSETSAVGLLPAALQEIDIDAMLAGAATCDEITRKPTLLENPAAMMAVMWHLAGDGVGEKAMVVLPYKDRLALLGKYLQQLVMESLGKRLDRDGHEVCQGLTVYGNKGSTDQHAYVQQLRDGTNNFFATFVQILADRDGDSISVELDITTGDYLHGFLLGTRRALHEAGRASMTLTLDDLSPRSIGVLIALFERAVGLYASLININAYHQPGVEAGKKAAGEILALQLRLLKAMRENTGDKRTANQWADMAGASDDVETVFHLLRHLAATRGDVQLQTTDRVIDATFSIQP